MGIWEENHSRRLPPWNGDTLTRGMEFGVSPFPETRRQMVDRGSLFDVPTYRWLPAKGRVKANTRGAHAPEGYSMRRAVGLAMPSPNNGHDFERHVDPC